MGFLWWLGMGSSREPRESRRLARLEKRISVLSGRLEAWRRRKERTLAAFRLYAFFFVCIWTAYAFTFNDLLFLGAFANSRLKAVLVLSTSGGAYLFLYKIASLWYRWRIESAEERLAKYREEKAELLEQLKESTRFYETIKLLEKYGGVPDALRPISSAEETRAASPTATSGTPGAVRAPGEQETASSSGVASPSAGTSGSPRSSTIARLTNRVVDVLTKDEEDWDEPQTAREAFLIGRLREMREALTREHSQRLQLQRALESLERQLCDLRPPSHPEPAACPSDRSNLENRRIPENNPETSGRGVKAAAVTLSTSKAGSLHMEDAGVSPITGHGQRRGVLNNSPTEPVSRAQLNDEPMDSVLSSSVDRSALSLHKSNEDESEICAQRSEHPRQPSTEQSGTPIGHGPSSGSRNESPLQTMQKLRRQRLNPSRTER